MSRVYLPNLNGLRFIAASLVIVHHTEQIRSIYGLPNYFSHPCISLIGKLGVVLFFVLSGFLITYLLMREQDENCAVSVRDFYIRRALRIWPLYYLVVLIAFFIAPQFPLLDMPGRTEAMADHFTLKLGLFLFLAPNVALALFPPVPYIAQGWSIGSEEHCYLVWPWFFKRRDRVLAWLVGIVALTIGISTAPYLLPDAAMRDRLIDKIVSFWGLLPVNCMAIGGIGGWIFFRKRASFLKYLYDPKVQALLYAITAFLILQGVKIRYLHHEIYAALFVMIILNLAGNPRSIFNLENGALRYLGKISYGLYMYHPLAVALSIHIPGYGNNAVVLYAAGFAVTILFSALSYELFEKRFIRAKVRFSRVVSGDNIPMSGGRGRPAAGEDGP